MKMNVKGLVFVGFAAAVFAGAANAAGDKIVTSKTYVDAKISDAATISSSSTSTAPNEKAVYDALALKANDSAVIKGVNDPEGTPLTATNGVVTLPAAQAVNNGTLTITVDGTAKTFTANQGTNESVTVTVPVKSVTVGGTEVTPSNAGAVALGSAAGANLATNGVADGETGLVTGDEVDTAIADAITAASGDYATAAQGAKADTAVQSVVAGDSGVGTIKVDGTTVTAYGLGTAAGANTTTDTTLAASGETGKLPTAATVKSYVDSAITTASGDYATSAQGAKADTAVQSVVAGDSGVGTIKVDGTTVTVYGLGTAAGAAVATNGVADSETGLVSGDQVHDYVSTLNNGLNLPANNTAEGTACDTNNPCALVWSGTGQPEWKRIQQ